MSPPSHSRQTAASRGPFAGVARLLIDGNNLLHRTAGSADAANVRLLLARLRAAMPAEVATTLMLDGHPAPGEGRQVAITRGLEVRHAGGRSADDALIEIVLAETPWARSRITLVSDDRALVERARTLGARTQRLAWLDQLLTRPGASPRPPSGPGPARDAVDDERTPWKSGRGATRKKGNPRRSPRQR
jgi:rRNA-processing protein FCF1